MQSPTARLGHILITAVFIAIPVLMFAPKFIIEAQYRALSPGDRVLLLYDSGEIISLESDKFWYRSKKFGGKPEWARYTELVREL